MTTRSLKYGSGKGVFVGQSVIYPIPIPLNPSEYFGAALVAEDGQFYYSNGIEWLVPVEDNLISRPNALVPFTVDEQTQLRLTPYRSPGGIDQLGAIFEISTNGLNFNGSITRIVEGVGTNMYQLLYPEDGFDPGEVVLWRAAYVGVGGVQSSFSLPYRQTFPELITTPTAVTRDNAISGTVTITDFESAGIFGYQYHETQVEFYEVGDVPGVDTPFHAMTTQAGPITTIPVPPLLTATQYVWRARYGGKVTSVAPTVYSPWTFPRNVFVGAASIILQYDLNLALSRTVFIPLGGGTVNNPLNVTINWGDGTTEAFTTAGIKSHIYGAGYTQPTVQVTISGRLSWYGTDTTTINQQGLTRVENIGFAMGLTSLRGAFRNTALTLTSITENVPETVTDMSQMFMSSTCAADLRNLDTRNVQNMSQIFLESRGVGPNCANWDVRNVTNVFQAFGSSQFNSPFSLGNWLSLTSMEQMFVQTRSNYFVAGEPWRPRFNQPIEYWDVSRITNMRAMFGSIGQANVGNVCGDFNQPLEGWDVSKVTTFEAMFGHLTSPSISGQGALFNQPLNGWDVSSAVNMSRMFNMAISFNQPLGNWNVSKVTNMSAMFGWVAGQDGPGFHTFNQPSIAQWNVSAVTNMSDMFRCCNFDQPLANWERPGSTVGNVTNTSFMFASCLFNQPIGNWDVGSVQNMSYMFSTISTNQTRGLFNQDIGAWDVSSAQNMSFMFAAAGAGVSQRHVFNNGASPSINNWNTSAVTNMSHMFYSRFDDANASHLFNQPIGNWNVSNVTDMTNMFAQGSSRFNQDISQWNLRLAGVNLTGFLNTGTTLTHTMTGQNYSRLLTSWANQIASGNSAPFLLSMTARCAYNNTNYQPSSRFTNAVQAREFLVSVRDLIVSGSSDADANAVYILNPTSGIYTHNNGSIGYYFLKTGASWTLYNLANVALATGTGNNPWDVPTWTGVLSAATVLIDGAAWTITGDVAA